MAEHTAPGNESPVMHDYEKGAYPHEAEDSSSYTNSLEAQDGVKKIEGISRSWSKWGLIAAYVSLVIIANCTSLEVQTTWNYTNFATSAFAAHSLIAAIYVIQGIVNAISKPISAKIADVFGRLEAFTIAVGLYTLGYILQASCGTVETFAAAQIFYSAGSQGLQLLQQIFAADTTDLLNRAFFSTIFDIPFLWTTWAGSPIAQSILTNSTWRWGYGMWAIILPCVFAPLFFTLWFNQRRAKKLGLLPPGFFQGKTAFTAAKQLWFELDFFGLILLAAAITLILLPLTLAASYAGGWQNARIIAMLVIGGVFLLAFPFWERSTKLAPYAFFPRELFQSRTVLAGIAIGFFYFMAFYLSIFPYFSSYLLVVQGVSVEASGHIVQTFSFTSTIASIIVSIVIKYTAHYKYFVTIGGCVYLLGIGLMIRYRDEGVTVGTLVGCQIAAGIGGGMLNVPAQLGVQASASHQQVAAATAVFLTVVEIGGAVGNAISGAIWTHTLPGKLAEYLPPDAQSQATAIYGNITLAISGYPAGSPEKIAINRAFQETMTTLLTVAVCCAAPIIPLSLFMKNYKLDKMDQHVKGKVIGSSKNGPAVAEGEGAAAAAADFEVTENRKETSGSFLSRFKGRAA